MIPDGEPVSCLLDMWTFGSMLLLELLIFSAPTCFNLEVPEGRGRTVSAKVTVRSQLIKKKGGKK